jgi:membrane-associated phospholipid phosphatase
MGAFKASKRAGLSTDRRLPLTAAISAFAVFALLTANVIADGPSGWDRMVFRHLYTGESDWAGGPTPGQNNPALNAAEPFLYRLADARTLVLLTAAVVVTLILLKRLRAAAFFVAAISVTALVPVLKPLIDRPAPFPVPGEPSFPSGHATGSMAAAAGLVALLASGRWRWLAGVVGAILVAAVGIATIADSGHWPSDVLAGWCLAVAWIAALSALVGHRLERSPVSDERPHPARPRARPPRASPSGPG